MIRIGYPCINLSIPASPNSGMIKRTFLKEGLEYVSSKIINNIESLIQIIEWNHKHNIQLYRMSSSMFPWMSEYEIEELPKFKTIKKLLGESGELATKYNQRLSFHPGPFNQLGSINESVVNKTIKELNQHSQIMDLMNRPISHMSKINIHIGNATKGKESATERFCNNFKRLNSNTKKRLVIENDDKAGLYTVQELYDLVYSKIKTPITFDYLHHKCNPGQLTEYEALKLATSTWSCIPCTHYSSSRKLYENNESKLLAHADYVYEKIETYGINIDIMIESKMKDISILKYRNEYERKNY